MSKLFSNILTKLKPSETGVTLQRDHLVNLQLIATLLSLGKFDTMSILLLY